MSRVVWLSTATLVLHCASVEAQPTRQPVWEVEVHGGGVTSSTPESGTLALPAPGPPVPPNFNRPVSSWYFGDGSAQVNQFPSVRQAGILNALDGTLQSRVAARQSGGALGVRLARRITTRMSAELTVDYAFGPLALTRDATSALEASRASFITAFNGLFIGGLIGSRTVNSTLTISDREGAQLMTTGAVRFDLLRARSWTPYVAAGLGAVSTRGDAPRAVLTGTYQVVLSVPFPVPSPAFNQTDTLTATSSVGSGAVWVLGGGVRFSLSDRWGARIDVRDHMHGNTITTRISASPTLPPSSFGTYITGTITNPPLVFSGSSFTPSTLSVPLTDFVTFSGSGVTHQVGVTTGLSWRF